MATGLEPDSIPLVKTLLDEWEEVADESLENKVLNVRVVSDEVDGLVVVDSLSENEGDLYDDADEKEEGIKGVADVDYLPENDNEISMIKGDIVLIQEQTIDQQFFSVINLRTSDHGEVPVKYITLVSKDHSDPVPSESKLHRSNVVLRRRPASRSPNRRTGSYFDDNLTATFPLSGGMNDTASTSKHEPKDSKDPEDSAQCGKFVRSESYAQSLPVQYKRLEKFQILSVSGTDKLGRPVIIFSACRLPPSYQINHNTLFEYVKYTLDQYVENDYTVVYFHHGLSSLNKPTFGWLHQIYKELDRKYKKNLKKFFIVHPTTFVKIIMTLFRPILSYKFGKKLVYINRLAELDSVLYMDQLDIPKEVIDYDRTLNAPIRSHITAESRSSFYVNVDNTIVQDNSATLQFGVPISILKERSGEDIPLVVKQSIDYITQNALNVVGIFRRTPSQYNVQEVKRTFNEGKEVDFSVYNDPHLVATILKMFLRELPEPLLTFSLHSRMSEIKRLPEETRLTKCRELIHSLPELNYVIANYIFHFITQVVAYEEENKMTSTNLSIVFGPNLLWSKNEVATLNSMSEINRFTLVLINHYSDIFTK